MQRPRFQIADCPSAQVRALRAELGVSGALAQVLVRRGFGEVERARAFLAADEQHDASAFAGIDDPRASLRR
jgi:single-stranded-DNA-specific exonuclease